jgi:hypothetical protein
MKIRLSSLFFPFVLCSTLAVAAAAFADDEKVGVRPYEMDWAGRTEEVRTPVCDFENLDGWTVKTTNAVATFERSREEQMYGKYVGKLTYRMGEGTEAPVVDVVPPEPIEIPEKDFDAFSCWIVGNNWGWSIDPTTPQVRIYAVFLNEEGREVSLTMVVVDWNEWFLAYKLITPGTKEVLGTNATFNGFRIINGTNTEDRTLYFDSFCAFKEKLEPLEFKLRAKPGIDLFEGQPLGINAGKGRLPFPTTPDTILPESSKLLLKPAMHFYGDSCDFVYEGQDGTLVYDYKPQTGDWSDVTARWNGSEKFYPCAQGGVKQLVGEDGKLEDVESAELETFETFEEGVRSIWTLKSKTAQATVEYRFQMKGKSLIVDTIALGGNIESVMAGRLDNVVKPRVFAIPYYLYHYGRRPGAALFQPKNSGANLFATAHIDWYRSGASYLMGRHGVEAYEKEELVGDVGDKKLVKTTHECAYMNGSCDYNPKTDGTRNDVYDRFIFTVSPEFAETLPSIPNPKSPYREVAGKGVWRAHGATTRDADKKFWREVWRRGMRHIIVTDHEVCWRDGGESFTFRTKPAPKKGGDAGWIDYSRFMQDTLGFVYGPYNNFTDFAPVNEYWSPDMIGRDPDGALQRAWMRCYAPKPTRAVEYCEKLTPINQEKFQFSCAYCDVHSSVPPWTRTDYDVRVPGAGTFMSVFYPYGEIFLIQKKNWQGPTYSEGPHHCFYAGLTDGNYAQDQPYNMFRNQWLLDFDLLKIHEQEVDFGMGNLGMFAPGYKPQTDEERDDFVDRFLAATLAFGHSGFFVSDYGLEYAAGPYFMVQQIASRYTQTSVDTIRYFNEAGEQLDTSAALIADVVKNSQVCVTYQDGTVVVANGSTDLTLQANVAGRDIVLPPNGYTAWTSDGQILVESFLNEDGTRFDYCESPEYIFLNGRGVHTVRNLACGSGSGVCRILEDGTYEVLYYTGAPLGFKIAAPNEEVSAVALDYDMNELGPAQVKRARGFVYVEPVEGAFSYILTKKASDANAADWSSDRAKVAPGETVQATKNAETIDVVIPNDAPYGLFWLELNSGEWLDFEVVPFITASFEFDPKTNVFKQTLSSPVPNLTLTESASFLPGDTRDCVTIPSTTQPFVLSEWIKDPQNEGVEKTTVAFSSNYADGTPRTKEYELTFKTTTKYVRFEEFSFGDSPNEPSGAVAPKPYVQRRGAEASQDFFNTSATSYFLPDVECGGVVKPCRFLHPPYSNGPTGRVFLRNDLVLPDEPATFRMSVGKRDGSDVGDGIKFQVAVAEFNDADKLIPESEKTLAELVLAEHKWVPFEADLSEYAGQAISLLVVSDANENPSGDWAAVAEMRLESKEQRLWKELVAVEEK